MILQKNYLETLKKNYEFCDTFFDYLTFNFSLYEFKFFEEMHYDFINKIQNVYSLTNSNGINFRYLDYDFSSVKLDFNQGTAFLVSMNYMTLSVPYMLLYFYDEDKKGSLKNDGQIILYGSFFALQEIGANPLYETLISSCFDFGFSLSRVDIKNDLFSYTPKEEVLSHTDILQNLRPTVDLTEHKPGGKLQSWSYGKPSNKKNTSGRKVYRFYNKFIDIQRRGNQLLYNKAFVFSSFHRFELELKYKEVSHIKTYSQLQDFLFSYSLGIPRPPIVDKYQYIKSNPCIVQIERSLGRLFRQIKDSGLPVQLLILSGLENAGYTPQEIKAMFYDDIFKDSSLLSQTLCVFDNDK